jgi:hypothetical protein
MPMTLRAAAVAGALAVLWLVLAPRTPDLAAQVFRAEHFRDHGFAVVNLQWYGGHHMPSYSLLFPPLAALLGERVVGALAAVACAALFAALAREHFGERATAGVLLFAAGTTAELLIGRLTFVLGTAVALAALLAVQRRRPGLAVLLAVATTAASPVAALFLAMAALVVPRPAVAAAALGSAVALALAFASGGAQSWGGRSFALVLAAALLVAVLLPRHETVLRRGAVVYAAASVVAFVLSTPMGSNATRVAALLAAPLLVCALPGRRRPALIVAAAVPLLVYQWWGPVREVAKHDASATAAYHAPLVAELERRGAQRVEVPFTRMHWESVHVALRVPLARGWEAQLDRARNPLFHEPGLTAGRYRRWLRDNAVGYVALPDVALDPAGRAEGRLVARGVDGLDEVWRNAHWRLYRVAGARSVGARTTPTSFTVTARRAGRTVVRVRHSRYWRAARGAACLTRARGDWTEVRARRPGTIEVEARLDQRSQRRCGAG